MILSWNQMISIFEFFHVFFDCYKIIIWKVKIVHQIYIEQFRHKIPILNGRILYACRSIDFSGEWSWIQIDRIDWKLFAAFHYYYGTTRTVFLPRYIPLERHLVPLERHLGGKLNECCNNGFRTIRLSLFRFLW